VFHGYQTASCLDEVQGLRNVGILRMDLDTKEIRETHNLFIESTHGSLKNIKDKNIFKKCKAKLQIPL